jgi:(p)ppGpp synthase/HD superfamily hydrolase
MKKIKLAKAVATKAHRGQTDRGGVDYINHPTVIADKVKHEGENYEIVAWLHDVIEDSEFTMDDIKAFGFNKDVTDAVAILTRNSSMNYDEYLQVIRANKIALKVKIADITHNSDLTRLKKITKNDLDRTKKYKKALKFLNKK